MLQSCKSVHRSLDHVVHHCVGLVQGGGPASLLWHGRQSLKAEHAGVLQQGGEGAPRFNVSQVRMIGEKRKPMAPVPNCCTTKSSVMTPHASPTISAAHTYVAICLSQACS